MNVQVTHVIVHEPGQVRGIILEALAIASELTDESVTHDAIFNVAVQLLGQRYTFAAPTSPVAITPPAFLTGNGLR